MRGRVTTTGELRQLRREIAGGAHTLEACRALSRSPAWVRKWNARIGPTRGIAGNLLHGPAWLAPHREAEARARLGALLAPLRLWANRSGQVLDEARFSPPASNVSGHGKETPGTGPGVRLEFTYAATIELTDR